MNRVFSRPTRIFSVDVDRKVLLEEEEEAVEEEEDVTAIRHKSDSMKRRK